MAWSGERSGRWDEGVNGSRWIVVWEKRAVREQQEGRVGIAVGSLL